MKRIIKDYDFFSIVLLVLLLFPTFTLSIFSHKSDIYDYLQEGSYVRYEQNFSTGENHVLYWEIIQINSSTTIVKIISHAIRYDSKNNEILIYPSGCFMYLNKETSIIERYILLNGTEIFDPPVGQKIALWIPTSVNESTPINNMYDRNTCPQSVGPIYFNLFIKSRMCWLTENYYSTSKSMKRWYDKTTGIVLMIQTEICFNTSEIEILEILSATNINALLYGSQDKQIGIIIGLISLIGIIGLLISLLVFDLRKKKKTLNRRMRKDDQKN